MDRRADPRLGAGAPIARPAATHQSHPARIATLRRIPRASQSTGPFHRYRAAAVSRRGCGPNASVPLLASIAGYALRSRECVRRSRQPLRARRPASSRRAPPNRPPASTRAHQREQRHRATALVTTRAATAKMTNIAVNNDELRGHARRERCPSSTARTARGTTMPWLADGSPLRAATKPARSRPPPHAGR